MFVLTSDQTIEVALSSDRRFYPGLLVTACSLVEHVSRNWDVLFHVIDGGIGDELRQDLERRLVKINPRVAVDWVIVDQDAFAGLPEWRGCGKMTWARLMLPRLLPAVHWVVYIDVDFLCMADVAELWRNRDDKYALMSALDRWPLTTPSEVAWFGKNGKMHREDRYFCAGLCFFNLEKIRNEGLMMLFADIIRCNYTFPCVDQSLLNLAFVDRDDLKLLPKKWQTFTRDIDECDFANRPFIHFAGEAPWVCFRINRIFDDASLFWFRQYAKLCNLTVWQALRCFYSMWEIIKYRAAYLVFSRSKIMRKLLHAYFRKVNHPESIVIYDALLHRVQYPKDA